MDDVVRRLVPCGFYKESGAKAVVQYGEHLLLDNINKYAEGGGVSLSLGSDSQAVGHAVA